MTKHKLSLIVAAFIVLCVSIIVAFQCRYNGNMAVEADGASVAFTDVSESDWFFEDVAYASKNSLMNGTSDALFSPNDNTTRGMIVTILWRIDGKTLEDGRQFSDVDSNAYYAKAVEWASNHQIVSGYNETAFGPDDFATREQLAAIIYRYAEYKNYDISGKSSLDKYIDKNKISDYALAAMEWANAYEIINGTSDNTLSPKENAKRCQIAAMLKRFCDKYAVNTETTIQPTTGKGTDDNATEAPNIQDYSNSKNSANTSSGGNSQVINDEVVANTGSEPKISISAVDAKAGDTIQLQAKLENNPGILGMSLTVFYDDSNLTLESVENGEAFKDVLDLTTSKSFKSGAKFLWDGILVEQGDIRNGIVLTMNFRVNYTATVGEYPISFAYADGDIVDNNLTPVSVQMTDGLITVK